MQLGTFQKDPRSGGFVGSIRTLTSVVEPVRLVPRTKADDAHKDAPDFDVVAGPNGSDFGAAWKQQRQSDGIEFLSCRLYDPAFNEGEVLRPALWPRKDGTFVMIHEPIEPGYVAEPAAAPTRPADLNGGGKRRTSRTAAPAAE